MKISYSWLKEIIALGNSSPEEIEKVLVSIGFEVSAVIKPKHEIQKVIVARILSIDRHPNADRLSLCKVTDGQVQYSVVCGAKNISVNDTVPLALPGAVLGDGSKLESSVIRGVRSEGMICSARELGIEDNVDGIMQLPETALGEEITKLYSINDIVLDIEIPANRSDCLGHIGIAREISAKMKLPMRVPSTFVSDKSYEMTDFKIEIQEPALCSRYIGAVIDSVKVCPSPLEMKLRLINCGLRPINNLVDITNYVMLETGHPLHLFDYNKLAGKQIIVRKAKENEKINALDSKTYTLDPGTLVIADGERAQAIAGIVGAVDSGVTDSTGMVVLETAIFEPVNIRKTQQKLALSTEAGYRFSKNTSFDACGYANSRAIELINKLSGGRLIARYDVQAEKYLSRKITLRKNQVMRVVSVDYPMKDVIDTLTRLQLNVVSQSDDKMNITVEIPSFRSDLREEIDLIEEIVRIQGYDTVPANNIMSINSAAETLKESMWETEKSIRRFLSGQGLQETVNYSFVSKNDIAKIDTARIKRAIEISNPVSGDFEVLHDSLIYGLLKNVLHNYNNQNAGSMKFYELGRVFSLEEGGAVNEEEMLCIMLSGLRKEINWNSGGENIDFYDLSSIVSSLLNELGVNDFEVRNLTGEESGYFIKSKSAEIVINSRVAGRFGMLNPFVCGDYDNEIYYAEIPVKGLVENSKLERKYLPFSRLPGLKRDISLVVPEDLPFRQVSDAVLTPGDGIKTELRLFDIYRGEKIGAGKKSLALTLVFSNPERTLTDEEVNRKIENILASLSNLGIKLRS